MLFVEMAPDREERKSRRRQPCRGEAHESGAEDPAAIGMECQVVRSDGAGHDGAHVDHTEPSMKTDVAIAQPKPDLNRPGKQRDHARGDVKEQPTATRPVGAELHLVHTEVRHRDDGHEDQGNETGNAKRRDDAATHSRSASWHVDDCGLTHALTSCLLDRELSWLNDMPE